MEKTDFFSSIEKNKRKTFWFFVIILAACFATGAAIEILSNPLSLVSATSFAPALSHMSNSPVDQAPSPVFQALKGGLTFLLIGFVLGGAVYLFGGPLLIALSGGKDTNEQEEPVLHHVVAEMAIAAGLPKPKIAIADKEELNVYTTGMNPENATIVITRGALKNLSREELQAVVAHEIAHIGNWDTRYTTYVSIFVGLTLFGIFLANKIPQGAKIYKKFDKGSYKENAWIISLISFLVAAIMWIVPFLMRFMKNNAAFEREFLADASEVQFTRNPNALISALEKFKAISVPQTKILNPATQFLSFAPYWEAGLFSEIFRKPPQPTLDERITRLKVIT